MSLVDGVSLTDGVSEGMTVVSGVGDTLGWLEQPAAIRSSARAQISAR